MVAEEKPFDMNTILKKSVKPFFKHFSRLKYINFLSCKMLYSSNLFPLLLLLGLLDHPPNAGLSYLWLHAFYFVDISIYDARNIFSVFSDWNKVIYAPTKRL